jgi:hypothetical protein
MIAREMERNPKAQRAHVAHPRRVPRGYGVRTTVEGVEGGGVTTVVVLGGAGVVSA